MVNAETADLSMEAVSTHESAGVSGIHVLVADHTRPLVRVLHCRVNRGWGLGHGGQGGTRFHLGTHLPTLGPLPGLNDATYLISNGVQ